MKENIEKRIETFVYGVLSLMFAAAFFFGVLYPSYGISPKAYRVAEEYDKQQIHYTFYFYERLKNS